MDLGNSSLHKAIKAALTAAVAQAPVVHPRRNFIALSFTIFISINIPACDAKELYSVAGYLFFFQSMGNV